MLPKCRVPTAARLALVGAIIAGLLLTLVLVAVPHLHARLHHDADHQEHTCLVTILQSGGFDEAPIVTMAVVPMAEMIATAPVREVKNAESFFLSCRVLEHAPPFVS